MQLVWPCDAGGSLFDGGGIGGLLRLGGASSPAAAVVVSGGFNDFASGKGDGLADGNSSCRQGDSLHKTGAARVAEQG